MKDLITIIFLLPALMIGEVDQYPVLDLPVKYGENATHTVPVNKSLPTNYRVVWRHNNNTVGGKPNTTETSTLNYHMVSSHGFSLKITNMVRKLEGEYQCLIISADGISENVVATVLVFIPIPDTTCYIHGKILVSDDTRAALLSLPTFSGLNKPRFVQVEEDGKRICDFNSTGVSVVDTPNRKCYTNSSFTHIKIIYKTKDFDFCKLTVIEYYAVEQKRRKCTCNPSAIKDGDKAQKNTTTAIVKFTTIPTTADGDKAQKNTTTAIVKFTTIPTTAEGDKHQIKTASPMNPSLLVSSAKIPNRTEVTRKPTSHSHKTVVGNPIFILMIIAWLLSWLHY